MWLLLACDGCWTSSSSPETTTVAPPPPPPWICQTLSTVELSDVQGAGPVLGYSDGESLVILADAVLGAADLPDTEQDSGADPTLSLFRYNADGTALGTPVPLAIDTAGGLRAEALSRDLGDTLVVARQEGGRRAYFFGVSGEVAHQIVTPQTAVLGRRVSVALFSNTAGDGAQVLIHTSGTQQVELGRFAGDVLDSRTLNTPLLLVNPAAAAGTGDAIGLATVEQTTEGSKEVALRLLQADGTSIGRAALSTIDEGARVGSIAVTFANDSYFVGWLERTGGRGQLRVVGVDSASGNVRDLETITPRTPEGSIDRFALSVIGDRLAVVYLETGGDSVPTLRLRGLLQSGETVAETELVALDTAHLASLEVIPGSPNPWVLYRPIIDGEQLGPVVMGPLSCELPSTVSAP